MASTAAYLYCIVKTPTPPKAGRTPGGLPGASRPEVVGLGRSLWLVVADVPLDRYGPEHLESALRDIQWVADVAVAHEAVVEHFARMRGATVIPMKLFTMFSTKARAAAEMGSRRRELQPVLARIAGCEEWGIRITRTAGTSTGRRRGAAPAISGAAFLAAKKQARDDARAAIGAAVDAADAAFDALTPIARDVRRRNDTPEGAVSPPLLDAAFLVPAGRRARFRLAARRAAAACARAGADMTLTGPWPAYNFVRPGESSR